MIGQCCICGVIWKLGRTEPVVLHQLINGKLAIDLVQQINYVTFVCVEILMTG